jgi:protease IV
MKKFIIGLLTGIILTGLAAVVMVFSFLRFGERRPTVSDGSTLVLQLDGELPEKAPVALPIPFIGTPTPVTVQELWSCLNKAANDSRIKAVLILADNVDVGWAKLQQVRDDLLNFRKSGKPLVAFLRSPGTREYYIATAADRIYMSPEDLLNLKGIRAEVSYYKKTLEKAGVEVEVEHIGRYKDAGDMFTQTSMSPETREVLDTMLNTLYSHLIDTIAAGRKRSPSEIAAILDEGPFTASQAQAKGLVDALRFEDQVYGELKSRLQQGELKKISHRDYIRATASQDAATRKRIAWIVGEGTIVRGSGGDAMGTDEGFSSNAFIQMLRKVANDKQIDGVILRVDSPGGDAFASDEILREVKLLRDKKPLVISMSDYAASGGYYVAMTGDPILAYPNTLTGSIGILYGKVNLRGLYDKLGIQKEILIRGKNAAVDSSYGPMTPEARAKLRAGLEEFYRGFVSKAAASRKKKYEEMEPLAQGRVWLGSQARQQGLVDDIGGIDRAIAMVKERAKIAATDKVRLMPYPPKRSFWEQYLKSTSDSAVDAKIDAGLKGLLGEDYRLWIDGGIMRLMPYRINIR